MQSQVMNLTQIELLQPQNGDSYNSAGFWEQYLGSKSKGKPGQLKFTLNTIGTPPDGDIKRKISPGTREGDTSDMEKRKISPGTKEGDTADMPEKEIVRNTARPILYFSWLPPAPIPPGIRVTYSLKIAEMYGWQSPYDAIHSNPLTILMDKIPSNMVQLPLAARRLLPGRSYAWAVNVFINGVLMQESEARTFTIEDAQSVQPKGIVNKSLVAPKSDPKKNKQVAYSSYNEQEFNLYSSASNFAGNLYPGIGAGFNQPNNSIPSVQPTIVPVKPFVFSGNVSMEYKYIDPVGSLSEIPKNSFSAILNPVIKFYGLPFSSTLLYSSLQDPSRQNINSFNLNFDLDAMKQALAIRLLDAVEDTSVTNLLNPDELANLRSPSNLTENLGKYASITGTESFFMSVLALGVGTNYPTYSEYTLSGVPVTGLNFEINPGIFYAAFTGAANQRGIDNSYYSRSLYAGRIGLGKKDNTHLFFTGLLAKDDENSILLDSLNRTLTPKANYVFGTEVKLNLFSDVLTLEGEGALAVLTRDTREAQLEDKAIPEIVKNIVDPRISSSFDYSYLGKLVFDNDASDTRISLGIKMVGPGYTSLGAPNLRADQFGYEAKFDQRFFQRRVSLGAFFKQYNDNLIKWKRSTTTTSAYGINLGFNFPKLPFLRISFSPYSQKNDDENPFRMIDNTTSIYSVMTGYSYKLGGLNTSTSLSFSGQQTKSISSLNDFSTGSFIISEAVSLKIPISFTASWGLINSSFGLTDSKISNIDLGANAQVTDIWSLMGGLNIASEADRNSKIGFYLGSNVSPIQGIGIDFRLEKNVYSEQLFIYGDYSDFIFGMTITAQW
jgi:hypothetical protein